MLFKEQTKNVKRKEENNLIQNNKLANCFHFN